MKESKTAYSNEHSLYILAENKPGVLERVIGVFTMRGYRIEHLIFNQHKDSNQAEIKINVDCTDQDLEKLAKYLNKQIYVLETLQKTESSRQDNSVAMVS